MLLESVTLNSVAKASGPLIAIEMQTQENCMIITPFSLCECLSARLLGKCMQFEFAFFLLFFFSVSSFQMEIDDCVHILALFLRSIHIKTELGGEIGLISM